MHSPRSTPFGPRHIRFDDVCKKYRGTTDFGRTLAGNRADRRYVAVVSGKMEKEGGTISSWLKDNKAYVTYSSPTDNGGKYAVTFSYVRRERALFVG